MTLNGWFQILVFLAATRLSAKDACSVWWSWGGPETDGPA